MDDIIRQFNSALIVPGIPRFDEVEHEMVIKVTEKGTLVHCLSAKHLLRAKESTGRPQDAQDILFLKELFKNGIH